MTEQEGQRRREDRAGWEGVGGVGEGVVGKRGGLRNWKKEDRSCCSLGLGHLLACSMQGSIMLGTMQTDRASIQICFAKWCDFVISK